ncbi:hypothetical protein ACS0TY_003074 [Phlomoides rotata]
MWLRDECPRSISSEINLRILINSILWRLKPFCGFTSSSSLKLFQIWIKIGVPQRQWGRRWRSQRKSALQRVPTKFPSSSRKTLLRLPLLQWVVAVEPPPLFPTEAAVTLLVRDWYLDSFRDLRSFPSIRDNIDEMDFTQMIKLIKVRHNNVVPIMDMGVQQLKKDLNPKLYEDLDEIYQILD